MANRKNKVIARSDVKGIGYGALICWNGEELPLCEWALRQGMPIQTLYVRIFCLGWPIGKALTKKSRLQWHGRWNTPEWIAWSSMKQRCGDPNCKGFRNYGARGITVCPEWQDSFLAFLEYMGKKPSPKHTLERLDNEKGYEPGNVVWALPAVQVRNTRRNVPLTFQERTMILKDWAREYGLPNTTLWNRLFTLGWPIEKALTTPRGKNGRKKNR